MTALCAVPDTAQVKPGGNLGYTLTFTNNTDQNRDFEYTLDEVRPDSTRTTLWGPLPLSPAAGDSLNMHLTEPIPGGTPPGSYSFKIKIGSTRGVVWSVGGFGFEVHRSVEFFTAG